VGDGSYPKAAMAIAPAPHCFQWSETRRSCLATKRIGWLIVKFRGDQPFRFTRQNGQALAHRRCFRQGAPSVQASQNALRPISGSRRGRNGGLPEPKLGRKASRGRWCWS